ncbi:hypothetical protein MRX96_058144 [Rhipicephalus microplus]
MNLFYVSLPPRGHALAEEEACDRHSSFRFLPFCPRAATTVNSRDDGRDRPHQLWLPTPMTKSGPPECLGGARRHPYQPAVRADLLHRRARLRPYARAVSPMSEPSGRHVWPASFIDQNGMVGSPSTPPEYYAPRATTPRAPTNRIALAAALESTRDRQPLLMTDAHTVPLEDGTVSPVQYCKIGLLFAGLCATAAWSVRP